MGLLDKFKRKKKEEKMAKVEPEVKVEKKKSGSVKEERKVESVGKKTVTQKKEKTIRRVNKDDTGDAYKILVKPLITEKVTDMGAFNKYVFEVYPKANKSEVRKAIQSLYGVDPIKINIINIRGRNVRFGRTSGKTKNWKKAIITLKQGDTIQVYKGV